MSQSATESGHEEPVLVLDSTSEEQAEVVRATLEAAGIKAWLQNPNPSAGIGTIGESVGDTWRNGVYVAASNLEAAMAVLNEPQVSDEQLSAESDAAGLAQN